MPRKKQDDGKVILKSNELDKILYVESKLDLSKEQYTSKLKDIKIMELQAELLASRIAAEKQKASGLKTSAEQCRIDVVEHYKIITKKYKLGEKKWGINTETGELVFD